MAFLLGLSYPEEDSPPSPDMHHQRFLLQDNEESSVSDKKPIKTERGRGFKRTLGGNLESLLSEA